MRVSVPQPVRAPLARVFEVFTDIEHCAGRIKGIKRVEIVSAVRSGKGLRWRETRLMFGKDATAEKEITASSDLRVESGRRPVGRWGHRRQARVPQNPGSKCEEAHRSAAPRSLSGRHEVSDDARRRGERARVIDGSLLAGSAAGRCVARRSSGHVHTGAIHR